MAAGEFITEDYLRATLNDYESKTGNGVRNFGEAPMRFFHIGRRKEENAVLSGSILPRIPA